ncbi:hypothetical protein QJS10_CPB18g01257 [Acorus calamus]|uniref:peptidylprolyl isomerase n=1 Tax=Acorus calamus TaxID=4465 RepID=A0AAV9CPH5_ACOCL|nr:hypothetical protein QJS10_CPB18g01257 [Acorus calamus]
MAVASLLSAIASSSVQIPSLPNKPNIPLRTKRPSFTSSSSSSQTGHFIKAPLESISVPRRCFFEVGLGLLASFAVPLDANATRVEYFATVGEPMCDMSFAKSGLGYCDVSLGTGVEPPFGQLINCEDSCILALRYLAFLQNGPIPKTCRIHYTARFEDGTVFDSSYKRGRPLTMRIGVGKVLRGLDQGIIGGGGVPAMHVGGKRKLLIPPKLAYGPEPAGCFSDSAIRQFQETSKNLAQNLTESDCNVPANATLLYDILFVGVYK